MSEIALQKVQSGPSGPEVGHGPLLNANCLPGNGEKKWTDLQRETYTQEDTSRVAHFSQLLREFLADCKAEGRSEQALLGLRYRLPKLFAYLDECSLQLATLHPRDAQSYIGWLSAQRSPAGSVYTGRTVAAYLSAASSFYQYLAQRGQVICNPFKEVRRVRVEKKLPRGILKEAQMKALLDELARFDEQEHLKAALARYRLHVVAELMYATGLRVSEVASLQVSDIDFPRSTVTVRAGKGGWPRVAFLGEFAREVLRLYVDRVRDRACSQWQRRNGELLFGTGWAWLGHAVNAQLASICAELDLPPMSSHGFRHAVGFHLLRAGCNIRHIQSILGHRRLHNTEVYTRVEKEDLKQVVDHCHPRRWGGCDGQRA
jgi:site-specific recombinase XerD